MFTRIDLLLLFPLVVSAFPGGGDHHGDGHDDHCVDISRYSEIQYNISVADTCTYRTSRVCTKKVNSACVAIPYQNCKVVGYAKCASDEFVKTFHDDTTESLPFTGKDCFQNGVKHLQENHPVPKCQNVTKEHCDSKWVLNAAGEKVWAGNENCQTKTWEECHLEDNFETIEVPVWNCVDSETIYYNVPVLKEVQVPGYVSKCTAAAYAECSTTTKQECATVEYEECADIIEPFCLGSMEFRIPYQTFDHRLKCIL